MPDSSAHPVHEIVAEVCRLADTLHDI
jgi:hypothetical protein